MESAKCVCLDNTIEDIAEQIDTIRDVSDPWVFLPLPHGHSEHIARGFTMGESETDP